MKHVFTQILMAGALSGAACAAPYVLPSSQTGALTPWDMQPVYAIEGLWGIARHSDEPDMWGPRLSFSLYSDAESAVRHHLSLNVAAMWGSKSRYEWSGRSETDLFMLPVTVGYDVNIELSERVLLYVGGKAGYAWGSADSTLHTPYGDFRHDSSSGGFTCSGGVGLRYMPSDTLYLSLGYEYAVTDFDEHRHGGSFGQHIISVGMGWQF